MAKYDLGIAGQFAELVNQIRSGFVNPIWARLMLQRIIENDHVGDGALLCRTFLRLCRPSLRDIADLLEIPNKGHARPFGDDVRETLQGLNFTDGPDEVEVVKVTAGTVFEQSLQGWSERACRQKAFEVFGLVACPLWVVPAIAIDSVQRAKDIADDSNQLMVCCAEEDQKMMAFNVIHGPGWWIHARYGNLDNTWEPVTWLMAKPY